MVFTSIDKFFVKEKPLGIWCPASPGTLWFVRQGRYSRQEFIGRAARKQRKGPRGTWARPEATSYRKPYGRIFGTYELAAVAAPAPCLQRAMGFEPTTSSLGIGAQMRQTAFFAAPAAANITNLSSFSPVFNRLRGALRANDSLSNGEWCGQSRQIASGAF